jgi:hypothetical protein
VSFKWSLSFGLPPFVHGFLFSPISATCPTHWFQRPNRIWRGVQIMEAPYYVIFSTPYCYLPLNRRSDKWKGAVSQCSQFIADNKSLVCQVPCVRQAEQKSWGSNKQLLTGACALWRSSCKFPFEITVRPCTLCVLFTRGSVNVFIGGDILSCITAVSHISSHTDSSHLWSECSPPFTDTPEPASWLRQSTRCHYCLHWCLHASTHLQKLLAPSSPVSIVYGSIKGATSANRGEVS